MFIYLYRSTRINDASRADATLDQMIPVDRWGTLHGIVPFNGQSRSYRLTVVAREDNTQVYIGNMAISLNAGGSFSQNIDDRSYLTVESSQPVMVAQMICVESDNQFDSPASMIVPPVEQFQSYYPVVIPISSTVDVTYVAYLLLVMPDGQQDHLMVDGSVPQLTWQRMTSQSGQTYVGSILEVRTGRHNVETNNGMAFGVMVYGAARRQCGFSYAAGQCLNVLTNFFPPPIPGTTLTTTATPSTTNSKLA